MHLTARQRALYSAASSCSGGVCSASPGAGVIRGT
jgi:hypothetical protein